MFNRHPMKVFFVGDNRNCLNWGRGASIALRELLSSTFEITGCVDGELFNLSTAEAGFVGTIMPVHRYRLFRYAWIKRWRRPFSWYIKFEQLFGAHDFIAEDPAVSIDNFLVHKDRHPALARIYDQALEADFVVLDGDGDIIFSTPPRRQTLFLLAMIELGVRLGKPVFLVNSMISDCPITGRNDTTLSAARRLFAQCRAVSLRDPESMEYVQKEMPETNPCLIPDSLFAWFPRYDNCSSHPPIDGDFLLPYPERDEYWGRLDFSRPYICIGGGALAASQPDKAVECYGRLVDAFRQLGLTVYLTENDSPDSFLHRVARVKNVGIVPSNASILMCGAVLAHARLFVSGRYHPSILASLGGTPCVFMGSHAHKMGSLSRVLKYDFQQQFNAFPDESEVKEIVSTGQKYLEQGDALRCRIKEVSKLRCEESISLPAFLKRNMSN
jgi:polysaccharide pyruvyl transferase WcaK-like protein